MDIGDKIYFKQKNLYVNQHEAKLHKGELIYKYRFCRKDGIWQEKIYNSKIKGISLEGEVLETEGEKVKLHLNIDESQDPSKAAWFYYAPPTGNILYSMPIVGESARLYFQDEINADPIVTGCVRKNGSTCEAMSDTVNRYFTTESGNYLDMLPEAISFHRSGLNVNMNDKSGITFSSSGSLSIGASGGVSLSGGSVSINATSQIKVQKSAGSYISLENEFYAQSSVVYESGSDRESYPTFTDDEPTAGVAEAKKKLEQQLKHAEFKDKQLMDAMKGSEAKAKECIVPASKDSIPLEGEDLKNRDDIPEFDVDKVYEEGTVVKQKSLDGEYILGTAGKIQNEQRGGVSQFTPYDSKSYSEHNSYSNSFKSMGLAGADFVQETFWQGAKVISYLPQFCEFAGSKIGLTTYSEDSWQLGREECDEISSSWHNSLYNMAPHKVVFNSSELVMNIYAAIEGGVGIVSAAKNIPKLISGGLKVAGFTNGALSITRDLSIATIAGAVSKTGAYGLLAGASINNSVADFNNFNPKAGTNKQKGNYGEAAADDNILNNQKIKDKGYDLESIGKESPSSPNDKIVKGIDGLYKNKNSKSNIKYVIDEAKFGKSQLGTTKDGPQMSDDWLRGSDRILKAVNGDKKLADDILEALDNNQIERVLSKVDSDGNVMTYRLNSKGEITSTWP